MPINDFLEGQSWKGPQRAPVSPNPHATEKVRAQRRKERKVLPQHCTEVEENLDVLALRWP